MRLALGGVAFNKALKEEGESATHRSMPGAAVHYVAKIYGRSDPGESAVQCHSVTVEIMHGLFQDFVSGDAWRLLSFKKVLHCQPNQKIILNIQNVDHY